MIGKIMLPSSSPVASSKDSNVATVSSPLSTAIVAAFSISGHNCDSKVSSTQGRVSTIRLIDLTEAPSAGSTPNSTVVGSAVEAILNSAVISALLLPLSTKVPAAIVRVHLPSSVIGASSSLASTGVTFITRYSSSLFQS